MAERHNDTSILRCSGILGAFLDCSRRLVDCFKCAAWLSELLFLLVELGFRVKPLVLASL